MSINIEEEKKKKEQNFKEGLEAFLQEYQSLLDNPTNFKRHSKNCGTQGGKIAESFCKYMILNSDKNDQQKINHTDGQLASLLNNLVGEKQTYLTCRKDKEILRGMLERVLQIRNDSAHENEYVTSKTDLDELRVILYHLSDFAFNEEITKEIINKVQNSQKNNNSKQNISAKTYIETINNSATMNFS